MALTDGGVFPRLHTCDGDDLPLPLSWDGPHPDVVEGVNGFGEVGYHGPCPPPGDPAHSYRIEVIGVAEPTGLKAGLTADELERATAGQQLSSANLTGRYSR